MDAFQIIKTIESAIDGVERPETSLRQFRLLVDKGRADEITREEWLAAGKARTDARWQDIPDAELEECQCPLSHMHAKEFQYYLPAYLRYSIRCCQKPMRISDILGTTLLSIYPSPKDKGLFEYQLAQLSLLDGAQKAAIVRFLNFAGNNADYNQRPAAVAALERYWNKAGNPH